MHRADCEMSDHAGVAVQYKFTQRHTSLYGVWFPLCITTHPRIVTLCFYQSA